MVDVGEAKTIRHIFRVLRHLANGSCVFWAQPIGHTHLVQVCIADKRQQTAVLVFPAETTDPCLARRFEYRNFDRFAMNSPFTDLGLSRGNCQQRTVVNRFHESIPQSVERRAQCADVFRDRYMLLRLRDDGPIVQDGAAHDAGCTIVDRHRWIYEVTVSVAVSDPQLRELACAALTGF
jgi:hypothetical protein